MEIMECVPGSLPEDLIENFEDYPYIIGDSVESILNETDIQPFYSHWLGYRKLTNKGVTWCGQHPRYWRELTEQEKSDYHKCKSQRHKRK